MPAAADGAFAMGWNPSVQNYTVQDDFLTAADSPDGGTGWYNDTTGDPSTTTCAPGGAFFYFNPNATASITFVGEVPQGSLSSPIPANYSLCSALVPSSPPLTAASGFPGVDGMFYQTFNGTSQTYSGLWDYLTAADSPDGGTGWYDDTTGSPVTPTPAPGVGYFIFNPGAAVQWNMTFNVQ